MAEFLEVMQQHAAQMIFSPESRDAPVQILGPLEAAGLSFDAMWFLGADDASWPAVTAAHPFLTMAVQRIHRMPHADVAVDWELAEQVTLRTGKECCPVRLQLCCAECGGCLPAINPGELQNHRDQGQDTAGLPTC